MATVAQKAILRAKISGVLTDLMLKTTAEQVYLNDSTTLAAKLSEMVSVLNGKAPTTHSHAQSEITGLSDALSNRPTNTEMNTAISTAITNLVNGAPEAYNTLKELADYIAEHEDVAEALTASVGNKADKNTVEALQTTLSTLQTTVNNLGALAKKSKVSESDLDDTLKEKVNAAYEGNHSHNNKAVLDSITSEKVTAWDGKGAIYKQASEPSSMTDKDLWIQIVD